jgi:hypothetical protein
MALINLDSSARLDITCRKGDQFNLTVEIAGISDTATVGTEFSMEVRETDTSAGTEISSASFNIVLTGDSLNIIATPTVMEGIDSGLYVYDLQWDNGLSALAHVVKTYLYGTFKVNEDVTV